MSKNNGRYRRRVIHRPYNDNNDNNYNTTDESSLISDNQQLHRGASVRKKVEGLTCSVCEGPAHGYNFDAITCESCKAFFRRNALKFYGKFKCRNNDGKCVITITTRKKCKACRLVKCFEKGMRADWILTDEERLTKKQKIDENRRLRRQIYPDSDGSDESPPVESKCESTENSNTINHSSPPSFSIPLSSDDLLKIQQIEQAYKDSVRLTSLPQEIPSYPYTAQLNEIWEMMNLPTNLHASRLISFFKLIPEFSSLNDHDKLTLVKHNTFTLTFFRAATVYDRITDSYHDHETDDCIFVGKDLIQCFSQYQYEQSTRCVCRILDASQNDHLLIKLMLPILLFSKGSAICTYNKESESIAKDTMSLFYIQNNFVDLFWKYCENKFGYSQTIIIWLKFIIVALDAHLQAYNTRENYVQNDLVAEQLVPLMKSVMLIV